MLMRVLLFLFLLSDDPLRGSFFFFNDPATTEISPLPLPDALPICRAPRRHPPRPPGGRALLLLSELARARLDHRADLQPQGVRGAPLRASLHRGVRLPERSDDWADRKSTRLNSSHSQISYAVFCLK